MKEIVRGDIESQLAVAGQTSFFIDKEVYDIYLPQVKDNIEDSSLSDFLLKYDLKMDLTELVKYFSPSSSRKRNFVNLRYLSCEYGYHLCYMALREAASKHNDNLQLVTKMRETGMILDFQSTIICNVYFHSNVSLPLACL